MCILISRLGCAMLDSFDDVRRQRCDYLLANSPNVREVKIAYIRLWLSPHFGERHLLNRFTIRRRRWITSLLCGLSACWRQPLVGGLKWRWQTQPSRSREGGNSVLFLFFFFFHLCHFILWRGAAWLWPLSPIRAARSSALVMRR